MGLFASGGENSGLVIAIGVILGLGMLGYHAFLFFCRPEQWEAMQNRKHEREMAKAAKAKAGNIASGIAGGVAKAILGAAFNHKRH